jgi:general secretion pathway protein G
MNARAPERAAAPARAAGFTLVELLVVLAILGMLVGIAVPQLYKHYARAKEDAAKIQIQSIGTGLDLFLLDVGRYPSEQEGLQALLDPPPDAPRWNGPYVSQPSILHDPWGRPYVYHNPGQQRHGYDLFSLGPDGNATAPTDAGEQPANAAR